MIYITFVTSQHDTVFANPYYFKFKKKCVCGRGRVNNNINDYDNNNKTILMFQSGSMLLSNNNQLFN